MVDGIGAGQTLLADQGYDRGGLRDSLSARGATACIRLMPTRKRFPAFDPILYRKRGNVEFY